MPGDLAHKVCPSCGYENPAVRDKCTKCGTPLPGYGFSNLGVSRKFLAQRMLFGGFMLGFFSFSNAFIFHGPLTWFDGFLAFLGAALIIASFAIDPPWRKKS